jgi:MFS family permease
MSLFDSIFSRALRSRNYRLYFAGQLVSLAGTWMQQIAMSWLAYRLSGSALVLGMVGFASQLPILLFGGVMGVAVDRYDRRRIMLATQSAALAQALVLAGLTWAGAVTPHWLVVLAFVLGCINALDIPARQAFSVQLVDNRDDLPNAIALNSFLMNAARFVGPALAGFAVAAIGEASCFLVNAASYLAVLLALAAIDAEVQAGSRAPAFAALRDGAAYAFRHAGIRSQLLIVAAVSFFVTPYAVMMPLFAREILGGDARTYGLLIGSAGAGSLMASLTLARRPHTGGLERLVVLAVTAAGAALMLFALNSRLWLAFPIVMVLGFSVILVIAGSNTLIQTRVEDAYRGRVMAIFSVAFLGIAPLGSLSVGAMSGLLPVTGILACGGGATILAGLVARRRLRATPAEFSRAGR